MLIAQRFIRVLLITVLTCSIFIACGQKGPLKTPQDSPTDEQQQGEAASE